MTVTDWLLLILIVQNACSFLYFAKGSARTQRWLDVLTHDRKIGLIHCTNPEIPESTIAEMMELNARVR